MKLNDKLLAFGRAELPEKQHFAVYDSQGMGLAIYDSLERALEVRESKRQKFGREYYIYNAHKDIVS